MVAYAPYVAGTAALSSVATASTLPTTFPVCDVHTVTVYEYAEPTAYSYVEATAEATSYPTTNAHGHGGPYYNPYDDVPLPFTWPGTPSAGETTAPPRPTTPYPYGGPAKDHYDAPAWVPKGVTKLIPSLPKGKQNGNSNWGELDCPHLPVDGLPGGPSYPSIPHSTSKSSLPPYPTSSSGYLPYSANSTGGSYSTYVSGGTTSIYVTGGSTSTYVSGGSTSTYVSGGTTGTSVSGDVTSTYVTGGSTSTSVVGGTTSTSVLGGTTSTYITGGTTYSTSIPSGTGTSYSSHISSGTSYSSSKVTASTSGSSSTPVPACPTMPDTGVTRTYEMNVAYQTIAPDGIERNGLVINGQFPGPLVEANWGDWILFKITNGLTDEGFTLHAHGLFQTETSWYDGVPAVAQCPITPNGGTFDMLFRADRYGTSWYHSHYSAQYSGGAHGPLVIYGPKHAEYDIDIGPIQLEDWFHADYYKLVNGTMFGSFPPSNNNLINGKMQYPCANTTLPCNPNAGISKFQFQSGKKHLLRLINPGAEGTQKFSIDGHTLTIVAQDFIPVEPYTTNVVTLAIGQRTDVIVEATGKPGDSYWMRSQLGTQRCTLNDGISPNAVAAVYYEDADTDSIPDTETDVTADQLASCKNDELTSGAPLCKIPLPEPSVTETIDFEFKSNGTNFIWFVNNSSYRGDYNNPILLAAKNGNFDYKTEWNVHDFGGAANSSVRLHLVNHGLIGGHPMHLHGHDFHVLAEGFGDWDGTVVNPENTVRRDVHTLQNAQNTTDGVVPSYAVLQFVQDNPGVWPLHCHLAWHVSGGLFMNVLERPDDIQKQDFDEDVFELCKLWDTYTASNPPNQIDSGL